MGLDYPEPEADESLVCAGSMRHRAPTPAMGDRQLQLQVGRLESTHTGLVMLYARMYE